MGGEITDRLKRMGLRIPAILEIRDEHDVEEDIYFIGSSIGYMARVKW